MSQSDNSTNLPVLADTGTREESTRARIDNWLTGSKHQRYPAAVCRIGVGLAVLGLLLVNFSTRQVWAGQASIWAGPGRDAVAFPEFNLLSGASADILTLAYVITLIAAAMFAIGLITRPVNLVLLVGFIAITSQNPVVGLQADNLLRLALLWMLLMRTADVWSIDRLRRNWRMHSPGRRRLIREHRSWDSDDVLVPWLANGLHNIGLIGLCAQVALLHLSAGLDKVTQTAWQHGTALYSTLQLPEYRFYPWVNDALSQNAFPLAVVTYAVMFSQLFFVPLLANRITRAAVVWVAVVVNVFFGLLLAQPWAALTIIGVTMLFASDRALERVAVPRIRFSVLRPAAGWIADRGYDVADWVVAMWTEYVLTAYDAVKFKMTGR